MRQLTALFRRELTQAIHTPMSLFSVLAFTVLAAGLTFYQGHFFERNLADLSPFFAVHPWLLWLLMPILSSGLWTQERQCGSIELLMTLPLSVFDAVAGKFLAVWALAGIALLLTLPMALTVNYLGQPDNGVICAGYIASWLLAGVCLAIGNCTSVVAGSSTQAYLLTFGLCGALLVCGMPQVLEALDGEVLPGLYDGLMALSLLARFERMGQGVLEGRDLLLFFSLIGAWLATTVVAVNLKYTR